MICLFLVQKYEIAATLQIRVATPARTQARASTAVGSAWQAATAAKSQSLTDSDTRSLPPQ